VAQLAAAARSLDLPVEERAYVPHITLLRSAPRGAEAHNFQPIDWRIAEFVLVQSALGRGAAAYDVIGRWPIAHGKG